MTPPSFDFAKAQRWCILLTLVLTASVVWPAAMDSTIAKLPLFFLGSGLAFALFMSESLQNRRVKLPVGTVGILLSAHVALFLVSGWRTYDQVYTWGALALGLSSLFIFLVASQAYTTKAQVIRLFRAVSWLTAVLCAIGALQYAGIGLFSFTFLIGPERRIPSFLGSSFIFGSYLVVVFPLLLAQALAARGNSMRSVVHYGLLAAMAVMVLLTQTRSSIIGLIVSMFVFVLLTLRHRKLAAAILVIGLALTSLAVLLTLMRPDIGTRFTRMFNESPKSSFTRRMYFWRAGEDAFIASPIVGHGIGSYERMVFDYRSPDYWTVSSEDIVPHAHNEIIEIGVEYGSVGLLLSIVMLGVVVYRGIGIVRTGRTWEQCTAAGVVSAIAGIAVDNLANVTLRQAPIALIVWLLMGLLFSQALSSRPPRTFSLPNRMPQSITAIPLLIWGLTAVWYASGQLKVINANVQVGDAMLSRTRHNELGALEHYRTAVAIDPKNLMARFCLTQEYLSQFQWENALSSVEDLQRLSPRYPQSSLMKAFALFRLQRYPEALEAIAQELRQRSYPFAYLIQASIYRALSNEQRERESTIQLLQKDISAQQLFAYRSSCQRLVQITRTEDQVRENLALFNALEVIVPNDHDFFVSVREQNKVQPLLNEQ